MTQSHSYRAGLEAAAKVNVVDEHGCGGGYDENGNYSFTARTVDGLRIQVTTYENGAKKETKWPIHGGEMKEKWIVPLPKPWWAFWR